MVGSFLEKIATEVRHLQKTEVLEAEEFFSKGQKGSSAMPHKRNPIVSEQICGLARLLRTNSLAAMDNNALWHERDISHSSVERIIFPDSTILLNYLLDKTKKLVANLLVYPENMKKNLDLTNGLIYSQKVLLELAKKGLKRQDAYVLVQKSAMKTWEERTPFFNNLLENKELMAHISEDEIKELFSYEGIYRSVDYIYDKCGLK
jgi:adenylosuccinate lyase